MTAPKIDCHCHLLDPAAFPYTPASPYHPAGHEIATAAQMAAVFAAHRVERALLVQPNSGYGEDNRCLLSAIAASGGRWKGIAVVPPDASLERLAELKAQGIVGVAFNLTYFERGYYAQSAALIGKLAELDLILQLQVSGDLIFDILPLVQNSPVRLLIDHCGRPEPARSLDQPGFQALLALGRAGRAAVKLSGYMKYSTLAHPFPDTWPFARALFEAFGPEACVWGSDWPFLRARARCDYGPLVQMMDEILPDPQARHAVFWQTPQRLFGF